MASQVVVPHRHNGDGDDKTDAKMAGDAGGVTLLKTSLVPGERIVNVYDEQPGCCRRGRARRVQLTTRRICYLEFVKGRATCFDSPPLLRHVLLKDVCEIIVDNYAMKSKSLAERALIWLALFALPVAGVASVVYGLTQQDSYYSSGDANLFFAIGGVLLAVAVAVWLWSVCRAPVPEVIFATKNVHLDLFAVKIADKHTRQQLLEDVTTLLAKQN